MALDMAARASLPLKSVTLSSARTMWGSCTSAGRVRLNFRLLQLADGEISITDAHTPARRAATPGTLLLPGEQLEVGRGAVGRVVPLAVG